MVFRVDLFGNDAEKLDFEKFSDEVCILNWRPEPQTISQTKTCVSN